MFGLQDAETKRRTKRTKGRPTSTPSGFSPSGQTKDQGIQLDGNLYLLEYKDADESRQLAFDPFNPRTVERVPFTDPYDEELCDF
jgi:hypothetical protein